LAAAVRQLRTGARGTFGDPLILTGGFDDLVIGTLGQLKGAQIDAGHGYDIFQVNGPPGQVIGAIEYYDDSDVPQGWNTIDSVGFFECA
jgi:hypothetical protein